MLSRGIWTEAAVLLAGDARQVIGHDPIYETKISILRN